MERKKSKPNNNFYYSSYCPSISIDFQAKIIERKVSVIRIELFSFSFVVIAHGRW